jgi:hypothetical protein
MKTARLVLLLCFGCLVLQAQAFALGFVSYKGMDMYHDDYFPYCQKYYFKFTLTPHNTALTLESYYKYTPSSYSFDEDGGQFDVYVPVQYFPVKGADMYGHMIIRNMHDKELKHISRRLFDKIGSMKTAGKGSVDIVVMVTEDVGLKIISKKPLQLEMNTANAYFVTDPWITKKFGVSY